jgi:hypothetical protein
MAGGPVSSRRSIGGGGNYQSYLNNANKIYGETLQGYQTALSGLQGKQSAISDGYNQLQANVLAGLSGASNAESQEIADRYTALSGRSTQDMISRGLGNTTVQNAVQRGITLDESKAQTDLQNKFAHTAAGYQSQLGLAGLGYRGQALQQQMALQGAQLGYMGGYSQQQNQLGLGFAGLANQARGGGGGGGGGSTRSGGWFNPNAVSYNNGGHLDWNASLGGKGGGYLSSSGGGGYGAGIPTYGDANHYGTFYTSGGGGDVTEDAGGWDADADFGYGW